jgi:hypothetical protein
VLTYVFSFGWDAGVRSSLFEGSSFNLAILLLAFFLATCPEHPRRLQQ